MSPTLHAESLPSGPPGKQYCCFICLLQSDGSTQLLIVALSQPFIHSTNTFHVWVLGIPW